LLIPQDLSELMENRKEVRLGLLLDASRHHACDKCGRIFDCYRKDIYSHTRLERAPLTDRNLRSEALG
jgi:hypothetical protein